MKLYGWLILLSVLLTACINEKEPVIPEQYALEAGDALPAFSISNGTSVFESPAGFKGKKGLIIFFTVTCSDCREAFPDMQQLYDNYAADESVVVLYIARGQTEEEVSDYFDANNYTMDFYCDPDRDVYALFASQTIPRVFVSNENQLLILTQTEEVVPEPIMQALDSGK